jgi:hypothetical protein
VAGLVGWITLREVLPRSAGAKYPKDAVEDIARVPPGSASAVFSARRFRDERLQYFPLLVGELHALLLLPLKGRKMEQLYPHSRIYEMAFNDSVSFLKVIIGRLGP